MRWHHRLYVTLRAWLGSATLDRELNEELQFHFDRQVQANLEAGMTPEQARRSAALLLGNAEPVREASRDGRGGALVRQLGRDMSYGVRLLRKAPGFSAAAVTIVALGVGAVTAIFSVVYGVALAPLPFREPERLVNIWTLSSKLAGQFPVNGADHRAWLDQNQVFEDIALVRNLANFNLVGSGEPERLLGARISANLFSVLGVSPAIGRGFTADEDEIGHDRVVILSDGFWRRRFGADPSIVGRDINLNGAPHTVVGVMERDFQYPGRQFQIWTPLTINPDELTRKQPGNNFLAVARLKPGVTVTEAQSEMSTIAARLAALNEVTSLTGIVVVPTHADLLANVRSALYVMLGAVSCLVLVAALNLATLLSARAAARSRELAVRLALGASRSRVALQSAAEIVPLLAIGGAFGVLLAVLAVAWFIPVAPPTLPRLENIEVNGAALAAAVVILTVTGLLSALLPAAQAWQSDLTSATREGARSTTSGVRQARTRNLLVIGQVALALPLLIGSVLLARSFTTVTAIDPGFNPQGTVSLHLAIPRSKYRSDTLISQVTSRFIERVAAVPGVAAVGAVNRLPLSGGGSAGFIEFEGAASDQSELVDLRIATPDYFRAMGIRLVEGRAFTDQDVAAAPQAGIVDERLVRLMWPGESALGKRYRIPARIANNVPQPWVEIVGVVDRVKHDRLEADGLPQIYWNYEQRPQDRMVLVARTTGDITTLAPSIIQAIHEIDPEQPVYDVRTMEEVVERSLGQRWLNMVLIGAFGSVALVLCAIGVYGVIAFGVTRQRREFGIRLALGASRGGIARQVMRRGLTLAAAGGAAGLVIAALLARSIGTLLYGVPATDVFSFGAATAVILAVALLASYLPARRAAAVDPAVTLRAE